MGCGNVTERYEAVTNAGGNEGEYEKARDDLFLLQAECVVFL